MDNLIEVVCVDMTCFKVRADTLEPVSGSYYEPAALRDPRGPQMSHSEWCLRRDEQRTRGVAACAHPGCNTTAASPLKFCKQHAAGAADNNGMDLS